MSYRSKRRLSSLSRLWLYIMKWFVLGSYRWRLHGKVTALCQASWVADGCYQWNLLYQHWQPAAAVAPEVAGLKAFARVGYKVCCLTVAASAVSRLVIFLSVSNDLLTVAPPLALISSTASETPFVSACTVGCCFTSFFQVKTDFWFCLTIRFLEFVLFVCVCVCVIIIGVCYCCCCVFVCVCVPLLLLLLFGLVELPEAARRRHLRG